MNPVLEKLGFQANDRVVIIHADDIGAYQASLPAVDDLFAAGLLSSCSTMVPCPWFPAVAEWARRTPQADIGVHATLTAEYQSYRWGPISTRDPASGMLDEDGYFPRANQGLANANADAVAAEHRAQLERALAAGIDVTHIDSHMGASFHTAFLPSYLATGAAGKVPNFLPRVSQEVVSMGLLGNSTLDQVTLFQQQLEAQGLPLIDSFAMMPLHDPANRLEVAKSLFDRLAPGFHYIIIHPAVDTPELRAMTPGDWQCRVGDHAVFTSPELRSYVRDSGIQVIGWRTVRDAMRSQGVFA